MALIPRLRPPEDSADAERADMLRRAAPVRAAAVTALAAAAFLAVVALVGLGKIDGGVPVFLDEALGPEHSEAPLERTPAPSVGVRINSEGYTLSRSGASVSVASEDVGGAEWRRHVHGVTRETEFGEETIVVGASKTEEFLTVTTRQGERTWRWKLGTRLHPRLGRDGSVAFLDPTRHLVTGIVIDPVQILDEDGADITPKGLSWGIDRQASSWWLTLELDDSDLPLPYVIDPAVSHRSFQTAVQGNGASLVIDVPAGVQANDLLVAHVAREGNATLNAPAGWNLAGGGTNGTNLRQTSYYRIATDSEPASYTWTWGGNQSAAGGMSAYYGAKATDPVDVVGAISTANSATVTAPGITTTTADALVLAFFSNRANSTFSTASGMTERYEARTNGSAAVATDDMIQATPGGTGNKTSTASASGRNIGHQVSFNVDDVAPSVTQNDPGSPLAGTIVLTASASDLDSAVAQVQFQGSPAGAGTWTPVGAPDTTFPYSVSFDTTTAPDGLSDIRAVATDVAGNVANSTPVTNRLVDNTAPSSTTTFPASAGLYNASAWDAGCAPDGLCGTHADAGSGVQGVEVSLRQGTGNYWNGTSFASAAEVWNTASLAGGNWSYAFDPSTFPADGDYTIRVRAVDNAANAEAPASRTFTIDRTAPQTTIDSSPVDPTTSTSADFDFSSSEGGSSFECRLDGGSWGACTSPASYSSLSDGSHTFDVRATDTAGNADASPASFTWVVDTTAPSSTISFPADGAAYNAAGWSAGCAPDGLCGTYSDGSGTGVARVELSIRQGTGNYWDGSGFTSGSEVWKTASLAGGDWSYAFDPADFPADGDYTIRVRAVDAVDNTEAATSRTFTFDATDPSAAFSFPAGGGNYTNAAWNAGCASNGLCGTVSDGSGSGVQTVEVSLRRVSSGLYWDGDSFDGTSETFYAANTSGGAWDLAFPAGSFPADGQYTVHVRATDDAGNAEAGPSRTFRVDNAAPSSNISFPAAGAAYNAVGWDAGCPASGLCGTYSDAGSGVTAVEISIRRGTGNYWDGSGFTSATEVWNGAALAGGNWSYAFDSSDLPGDGDYTIRVRATDDVGLVEAPSSLTIAFDTTGPAASFSFPAAGGEYRNAGWNVGCATTGFCGTHSDATSGVAQVEISVEQVATGLFWDGDSFDAPAEALLATALAGGDWSYAFAPSGFPADGLYAVHVHATDDAGNAESGPSRTFRLDNTDPSADFGFPASGGSYNAAGWNAGCATSGLCGTAADGGSGVAVVEVSLKRVGADLYWDGDSFDTASETFFPTTLAGANWSWDFDAADYGADGLYTAHVRASDDAGNVEGGPVRTFTVDTAAPQTTIDSSPADPTSSTSADFDFSSSEGGSSFDCRLDGGSWSACTSPESYAGLSDGSHTFDVRATDTAGNTDPSPASYTWTVDTSDPSSTISFPGAGTSLNVSAWSAGCAPNGLCGTYSDGTGSGVATVEVSLRRDSTGLYWDGASFAAGSEQLFAATLAGGSWSRAFPASSFPADGDYTARVHATDEAGNGEAPASRTFTLDTTAPAGSLTAPADGAVVRGASVTVSSDSADSGSGVDSAVYERRPAGGGAWTTIDTESSAPFSVPWDTTAVADGDWELRVVTTDEAGNVTTSATRTVTVDNTAPSTATLDDLPDAIREGFALTGAGADAGSGVDSVAYLYCEGAACSPATPVGSSTTGPSYSVTWSGQPADGDVRVLARVTDAAGNTLDSAIQAVTVDNTNPTGSLTAPADGAVVSGTTPVSSDSADAGSGVDSAAFERRPSGGGAWVALGSDTSAPYSVAWDTNSLSDGDYDLRVVTTDQAGNAFTSPVRTVTVDNAPPTVSIVAPGAYVNGGSADPFTISATSPDSDVDQVEFFRCSDSSAGCGTGSWVSLGADAAAPYSASWPIDPDGNRALRAVATDGAANTGEHVVDVTIDRTDPTGSLSAPAGGALVAGTVAVSSTATDAGSGVDSVSFERRPAGGGAWVSIDSDANAPYSVDWDTSAVADGDWELRAVTTDVAGNSSASAVRTVTVDNTDPAAPVVVLSESSAHAHVSGTTIYLNTAQSDTYDVSATSSDAGTGIDTIRFPGWVDDSSSPYGTSYDFDDLAPGTHTVTAHDRAGNTASSTFDVSADTASPAGGSVSYPDGYDADGDIAITLDPGSDALAGLDPASAVLERRTSPLADGSCDPFAGAWSTVTSPDTVPSGQCAQYRYRVSDRVGNEATHTSSAVVKVDLADPAAPALTLDETSPYAYASGTQLYLNTAHSGTYDVGATSSDPVSGLEKITFPGGSEDTSAPHGSSYDFDDLAPGTHTVTAHDRAGNAASSTFDVSADVDAPSTTDDSGAAGSSWQTAPVAVTLSPVDPGAGVAATYYTTDGSAPTTSSDEGTTVSLTADGVYTIRYFSVDRVGNAEPVQTAATTIRIDGTNPDAPAIGLDESSPHAHVSGDEIFVNTAQAGFYTVSATSTDAGSGLERIRFPGGVDDFTSPYSMIVGLGDLSGTQTVTAYDAAGNSASDTFTATPDTAPPTGGSVSYADAYDADGTVPVSTADGTDALAGVDASSGVLERETAPLVDGTCDPFAGGWSTITSPDTVATDTCARYRYRVSDRVGNEATYTSPDEVKVDLTTPQTTIGSAPADPSADDSPSFAFSSSETGSTFECRLDGGAWSACTSPESLAGLADGPHSFDVRATDVAGNVDPTPASHGWTVDTGAPQTTIDVAPPDPSTDDAPTFEFSADEGGSSFDCRLDGGAWTACTSPETLGGVSDGTHTFDVRATDGAGNADGSPASHAWTVDTVAPATTIDVAPGDPSNDPDPSFEFSASEGGSTFECRLDGGAWNGCSSPEDLTGLADGPHTFDVRATDAAGNTDGTPAQHAWTVNAVAPTITLVQPSGYVNAADADPYTVRATSPDGDIAGVELYHCSVDSADCATGTWVSLGSDTTEPYEASWPVDADGTRALRAVATDLGSNTGEHVVTVTIDRTVPATTIDSAPSDPSASAGASFGFSSSESGVTFECRLDGGAWSACSSPESYAGLGDGPHTFEVRAADAAGNVGSTPAAFSWTVDTDAPQTAIDVAPADPSPSSAPIFEFSADEGGSSFECRIDGDAWSACSSPESLAGLADGSHTFDVRAADPAGNTDASPASHAWTIDATPPGGGLADPGAYLRGPVALSASPSDVGAGVQGVDFQISPADAGTWTSIDVDASDPYGVSWDTTAEADGGYDLRVVVTDNAGNSTPSAVVEDRVVDNTAPVATMNDPGAYLRATVALTSATSDAGSGVASVAYQRSPAGAGSWTAVAVSWDTTSVADGLYDLRVVVTDNAGNSSTSAAVTDRRVDNTRPSLGSSSPADGTTVVGAGSLALAASEDVAGVVDAELDGVAAPAPSVSGGSVTYTATFAEGPHVLSGQLEDLAGNRQEIRVHFTVWSGAGADHPYVEKNSFAAANTSLRSTSDEATITVPAGAWTGAPAGDWLVVRLDPRPAGASQGGFQPAGDAFDATAYWALAGSAVTSFALPLELEIDNTVDGVVPATLENGAWRALASLPDDEGLPASWQDGFERDGADVRIFTRHLTTFALLEDVQAPGTPKGFKGVRDGKRLRLSWSAAGDNSGLVAAYRVYTGSAVAKTVAGSKRSVFLGTYRATDRRSFRVAAVDEAGNVGKKSYALKVVPTLKSSTLAGAKKTLRKRGFKLGKVTYKRSGSVAKDKVLSAPSGLRKAGSKIALSVSKGSGSASRPVTTPTTTSSASAPPPSAPPVAPARPAATAVPPAAGIPQATGDEASEADGGPGFLLLPYTKVRSAGLAEFRQELGFGILVAAFSIALVAALRARRTLPAEGPGDEELLWDTRLARGIGRFFRRLTGRF